jgi:hypothetical protein
MTGLRPDVTQTYDLQNLALAPQHAKTLDELKSFIRKNWEHEYKPKGWK